FLGVEQVQLGRPCVAPAGCQRAPEETFQPRMSDTHHLRRLIPTAAKFFSQRFRMPRTAFVRFAYLKSWREHVMPTIFETLGQEPPSAGTLSAAVNQAKDGHGKTLRVAKFAAMPPNYGPKATSARFIPPPKTPSIA